MRDQCTEQPIYAETVGLSTAEVYHDNGIFSVFLVGEQVACFLEKSTSFEDCQDEIESIKKLAGAFGML